MLVPTLLLATLLLLVATDRPERVRAPLPQTSAFADAIEGQGVERTGAATLTGGDPTAGRGLKIAVLDLGFGSQLAARQADGELPPAERLSTRSFDPAGGLDGTNAYGNPTGHGTIVAQTLFDYAPAANYIFANYHSPQQFVEAVDWLATQKPDIVLHSNNFIEGPFDGTSPAAQAVDRAAAAGALWFNSSGNYGDRHWEGTWIDGDGDRVLDWSAPWTITRKANEVTTFALSWTPSPGDEPTDLDLVLEARDGETWRTARDSRSSQIAGAGPAERITGYVSPRSEDLRLRVVWRDGPQPTGPITLYSREIPLAAIGGSPVHSVPSPADATGAIAVGAVDWRTNALKVYSSQGPSPDGRLKPDLVAQTGTVVRDGGVTRGVGGTSNSAPNAAGAAAALLWSLRESGLRPGPEEIRAILARDAVDLGAPGPDPVFGAGLVRIDTDPPVVTVEPARTAPVAGTSWVGVQISDAARIRSARILVDGVRRVLVAADIERLERRLDTSALADGPHEIEASAVDASGNRGIARWTVIVDNTRPTFTVSRIVLAPTSPKRGGSVRIQVRALDAGTPRVLVTARLSRPGTPTRLLRLSPTVATASALVFRNVTAGRYRLEISAEDLAGNVSRRVGSILVKPGVN